MSQPSLEKQMENLYGKGSTYTPGVAPGVMCVCKHRLTKPNDYPAFWARTTTEKDCPHHGPVGVAAHEERRKRLAANGWRDRPTPKEER